MASRTLIKPTARSGSTAFSPPTIWPAHIVHGGLGLCGERTAGPRCLIRPRGTSSPAVLARGQITRADLISIELVVRFSTKSNTLTCRVPNTCPMLTQPRSLMASHGQPFLRMWGNRLAEPLRSRLPSWSCEFNRPLRQRGEPLEVTVLSPNTRVADGWREPARRIVSRANTLRTTNVVEPTRRLVVATRDAFKGEAAA